MLACLVGFALCGAWLADAGSKPPACRVDLTLERSSIDWDLPLRWTGWVRRPPRDLGDADQLVLAVESAYGVGEICGSVQVNVAREPHDPPLALSYGDRVEWLAAPRRVRNLGNPGAFDRVGWLGRQGIDLAASARPGAPWTLQPGRAGSPLQAVRWRLRQGLDRRFERLAVRTGRTDSSAVAALRAILLGDRRNLTPQIKSVFQRSGVYHVLVVSGLHVGLLAGGLFWLLRRAGCPREWCAVSGLAVAAAYAALLEGAVPTHRATWMLAFYTVGLLLFRGRRALNVIAGVALAFLLLEPELLADAGFQLSFLSVTVIAGVVLPLLERTATPWARALGDPWNTDLDLHLEPESAQRRVLVRQWLEPLVKLTPLSRRPATVLWAGGARLALAAFSLVVLAAVLTVGMAAPLAWHFQQFAGGGLAANLAATPLLSLIVPAGLGALALDSAALFEGTARVTDLLVGVAAGTAETLPLDRRTPPPPVWLAVCSLAALAWLGWELRSGRRRAAPAAAAVLAAAALIVAHPFPPQMTPGVLELTAIDVGQGDALLLGFPDGSAGLVDAGGLLSYGGDEPLFDIGEAVVAPYLRRRSIRRLAFLAVTHPDADHLGGAAAILRELAVERLWLSSVPYPEYEPLVALANRRGIPVERLRQGEVRRQGGALLEALWPPVGVSPAVGNDNSLTLLVRYGAHEILLAGDLERGGEVGVAAQLHGVDGEVLKVAHHGSRTSTTPALLGAFRPDLALISAGYRNPFGHPHDSTLDRLAALPLQVFRTDRDGAVTISSDGRRLRVRRYRQP